MNILCLDQFGELGGAQRCLLDLIPAMIERGWSVHVAAPAGPLLEGAGAMQATFDAIRSGPYSSGAKSLADIARFAVETPRLAGEIRTLVRRYAADLVYLNGPRLLPAAALFAVNGARRGPRMVFHSHSLLDGVARRVAGRSLAVMRAAIVASCRFVAAPLLPYARGGEIRVVYNGVREIPLAPRPESAAEFRIGVIGRLSPEKGQADFLRAARILHKEAAHCRFLICGAPLFSSAAALQYCGELEALAEGLPVEFCGWTEDVDGVLATLDLLVVPSAGIDATPRVILEGFAAGVPVVAFASGGIPEIVQHGVTGFLVRELSAQALASTIRDLLREPDLLRNAAAQARVVARIEFSLERYRAEMVQTLEAALEN